MSKLIMWNLVSLDGFVEGPGRDISWLGDFWGDELEQFSLEQGEAAGALLFGRVTYELMANHWPAAEGKVADFMNALPKVVASRTLKKADWNNTRLVRENAAKEVAKLKHETKKDIFLFGSAGLAADLMAEGLFDEFRICVVPLLLGRGTPLFKEQAERARLRLLDARPLKSGAVILRYVPTQ